MAELEVIKHAKKVMNTLGDKEKSWKHKVKEVILEILIIVFAVSLSISLHNWSESRHDRHEEHEFLLGLKKDLKSDTAEMKGDSAQYERALSGRSYFFKVANGETLNKDSLMEYNFMFFNATYLSPNNSRFEGLKASGKLNIIQNKELLNNILDFYQETIPFINMNNQGINEFKIREISSYLNKNLDLSKNEMGNWEQLLRSNEIRNSLMRFDEMTKMINYYGQAIKKAETIIALIDEKSH